MSDRKNIYTKLLFAVDAILNAERIVGRSVPKKTRMA
jgi:hypothetical protein